jgi:hypothetical protein
VAIFFVSCATAESLLFIPNHSLVPIKFIDCSSCCPLPTNKNVCIYFFMRLDIISWVWCRCFCGAEFLLLHQHSNHSFVVAVVSCIIIPS